MPELPEVETTRRGIEPYLLNQPIARITVRQPKLRWPVPGDIQQLVGAAITQVGRRGKYVLLETGEALA